MKLYLISDYESEHRCLSKPDRDIAYVQAKIIRKADHKIYLRIWNSGGKPAYNVNFYIPESHRICVLRSRLSYKCLCQGKAFDEYAVADEALTSPITIVTSWEDEEGNVFSKEQTEQFGKIMKKI